MNWPEHAAHNRRLAAASRERARNRDVALAPLLQMASAEVSSLASPQVSPQHLARYLAHIEGGVPMKTIARVSGVTPGAVIRSVQRVEDSRENPDVDATLQRIGARLRRRWSREGRALCAG